MMTKAELLAALADLHDDAEIGATWDDCLWEIHGVVPPDAVDTAAAERAKYATVIDCR